MKKLKYRYSGNKSKNFWNMLDTISDSKKWNKIHSIAIDLQVLEEKVLGEISKIKKDSVKKR